MLGQTTIAVGIATILTANVWGALLLLFSTNHIAYPHAFSLAQNVLQLTVGPGKRNAITLVTAMIMGAQVVLLVARGRRNSRINWGVTVMGGGTLWLASRFCPWVTIGRLVPKLSQLLQFPVRLTSVAFPLMLCGLASA
ncbi:hypothetical protein [Lacticaseibacillus thailandensis]|uniref:hypothetical protein n=1 Tax=Lacticaseibacillus thailandensis TaxID=381741 RepID=UPI0006D13166|nr:hypothetical protein [Lacticaseibacillus thailandensis]